MTDDTGRDFNSAPFDVRALRRTAAGMGHLGEFERLFEHDLETYRDMAAAIHRWAGDGGRAGGDYEPENLLRVSARVLGEPSTRHFKGELHLREPFFHHGDVEVEGSFYSNDAFVITGSLRVGTVIQDCGPDSYILIGGDIDADAVDTDGTFFVSGSIRARQYVYGSYNDNICTAISIHSPLLIMDDHAFACDTFEVQNHFGIEGFDPEDPAFRELLIDECFDEERISSSQMAKLVMAGRSVFR